MRIGYEMCVCVCVGAISVRILCRAFIKSRCRFDLSLSCCILLGVFVRRASKNQRQKKIKI